MDKTKQQNQEEQPQPAPDLGVSVVKVENVRNLNALYTTEFSGISPTNLHYYLECSRKGMNFWKSLFFEEIRRRDLRIGGVCQTRKLAVANKEWEINFKPESSIPISKQDEIKIFLWDNINNDSCDGFDLVNFMTDIVEAQIQGVSTFELIYKVINNKWYIDKANYIPNHILCFDDIKNKYEYLDYQKANAMQLRLLGRNTYQDRIKLDGLTIPELHPDKVIEVHSYDGNAQNGFMNGCIDSLIWAFLFKHYGLKDWSIYMERFAIPSVIGKYPPLMSQPDKNKLLSAVTNFGSVLKAIIPDAASIEFPGDQNKSGTKDLFHSYTSWWDKEITIRVLGQSLTTDIGDTGSKAAAQVHDEVRRDLVVADMLLVKKTINTLIRRLIRFNFADIPSFEYPVFSFDEEEDIEYKLKRSEIFRNLRQTGYRVTQEDIENEFDVNVEVAQVAGAGYEDTGSDGNEGTDGNDAKKYIKKFTKEFWDAIQ